MKETKTYYYCPVDQYGQRNGNVYEIELTQEEYERRSKFQFIYTDYETALYAAQD